MFTLLLYVLYITTTVGYFKMLSKEAAVKKALDTDYSLALFCLVLCSLFWPVVSTVNYVVGAFQK